MSLVSAFWTPASPSLFPLLLCSCFQHLLWPPIWICACPGRLKVSPGAGAPLGPGLPPGLGLCLPDSPLQGREACELSIQDASLVAESSGGPRATPSCGLGRRAEASVLMGGSQRGLTTWWALRRRQGIRSTERVESLQLSGPRGRHACCHCSVGKDWGRRRMAGALPEECLSCPRSLCGGERCVCGACQLQVIPGLH